MKNYNSIYVHIHNTINIRVYTFFLNTYSHIHPFIKDILKYCIILITFVYSKLQYIIITQLIKSYVRNITVKEPPNCIILFISIN